MNFHQFPATYVGYVHLIVSDMKIQRDFYERTLGLKVLEESERIVRYTADGKKLLIVIEKEEDAVPRATRTTGLFHFALLVPERKDLARVLLHLLQSKYPLQGASDHLFSEAIYLADPEGNGIEIYRDRPADEWVWEGNELPLVSDPIDLENLLAEANNEGWTEFPTNTIMGHIHLNVSDLQKAKEFYHDALGFDITIPFRHQALFVGSKGYHHHLGLNTWNGAGAPAPTANSLGMKLFTIQVPTEEARKSMIDKLIAFGYEVTRERDGVAVKDSSGIKVLLTL